MFTSKNLPHPYLHGDGLLEKGFQQLTLTFGNKTKCLLFPAHLLSFLAGASRLGESKMKSSIRRLTPCLTVIPLDLNSCPFLPPCINVLSVAALCCG